MENEKENEIQPIKTMVPSVVPQNGAMTIKDLDIMLENAEKMATLYDRIRKVALSKTSITDWLDEGGKPYLQRGGCDKVAAFIGASYRSPTYEVEHDKDEQGEIIRIYCNLTCVWQRRELPELGSASSRDSFFGVRSRWNDTTKQNEKYFLPISEIDLTDLRKKSLTNALNRGIKGMLGLTLTWEEVAQITDGRITKEKVIAAGQGVNFGHGTKGGGTNSPATADARSKVWKQLLELADGEIAVAEAKLREYTVWTNKENKQIPGKSKITEVSDAMMKHLEPKVQAAYDEFLKGLNKSNPGKAA